MKWFMMVMGLVLLVVVGGAVVHVAAALLGFVVVPLLAFGGGVAYGRLTGANRKQLTR